ncbi:MAG: PQQ-binding-like beta-propeller repeat protein [Gammaproteobacteria bacterium]|nr:PQQ-binding-like beta-propeller repeat protein [Gammaproteobacteria bacterium]
MTLKHNFPATQRFTFSLSLLVGLLCGASALQADDLEVYLEKPSDPLPPNVLFMLDESGSMGEGKRAENEYTDRMTRLKTAMNAILDDIIGSTSGTDKSKDIRAGFAAYTTRYGNNRPRVIHDFALISSDGPAMKAQVATLTPLSYTPTVQALKSGIDWFKGDFTDHDGILRASPIGDTPDNNWCRPSHMVLLSDGKPNNNSISRYPGRTRCSNDPYQGRDGKCSQEIVTWAYGTDLKTGDDWDVKKYDEDGNIDTIQNVTTHTIYLGEDFDGDLENYMKNIAEKGGGDYYPANSAAELVAAFEAIIDGASEGITYSYNAPAIPFNSDNAAVSGKDLYVPLFAPEVEEFWKGNLKKFAINVVDGDISITAKDGVAALDTGGDFRDVTDFWNDSGSSDGAEPLIGGAVSHMEGTRNLYTYLSGNDLDLTHDDNRVTDENTGITTELLGVESELDPAVVRTELLDWVSWQDTGNLHEGEMGAPLHTSPAVATYGTDGDVVFLPTSEGVLEAIDATTGEELWAFMPEELLGGIKTIRENGVAAKPYYGLDGPLTIYKKGSNKYAIFGMRRGGKNYYLLNITDRTEPKFVKTISKTSLSDDLGQTWSKPLFMKMHIGGSTRDVLVFGGGYDEDQDAHNSRVADDEGNAIFIVNPATGGLIRKVQTAEMKNGIAGDLLPVDINANGVIDRLYAADVGGRIIRVDIPDSDMGGGSVTAGVVADVNGGGAGGYQRFFNTPAVGYFNKGGVQYLAILIGSGNRTDPFSTTVTDRFYMIKDSAVWRAPTGGTYTEVKGWASSNSDPAGDGDLYNATENYNYSATANVFLASTKGWFIDFSSTEKSFSKAVLYDYTVLFTTYSQTPKESTDRCLAQGSTGYAYGYAVNMLDASAYAGLAGPLDAGETYEAADRYTLLTVKGIPSSPLLLFPGEGEDGAKMGSKVYGKFDLGSDGLEWDDKFRSISWEEVIE